MHTRRSLGGAWGMRAQGGVDRINWRTCVVGLDAERFVRYITKTAKIPIQVKSELTRCGKKSKPESDTKNKHGHQSRPQIMPNRSLVFCSLNKCLIEVDVAVPVNHPYTHTHTRLVRSKSIVCRPLSAIAYAEANAVA